MSVKVIERVVQSTGEPNKNDLWLTEGENPTLKIHNKGGWKSVAGGGGGPLPENVVTTDQLETALATKVDAISGKGLSTNDYDDTEKAKVASAYQKPQTGIPASDLAPGAIPSGITLLELSSDIGTLTSEQLALVQTNNCVIKYTGNTSGLKGLYHKSYDSAEGLDYSKIQETKSNDDVRSYYFTCIKSTGEYNFGTNTDARPRVVGNPTIQEGTTPTTLMNLRIGFTDYAIPQGGGGGDGSANAQIRAVTQAGATGEGDIFAGPVVIASGNLEGDENGIYTIVNTTGNLTISKRYPTAYPGDNEDRNVYRWTGSEWEVSIKISWSAEYGMDAFINDAENNFLGAFDCDSSDMSHSITLALADYFSPDTGDVMKIKVGNGFDQFILNVGANNATRIMVQENFGGILHERVPADDAVKFSEQLLTSEQMQTARDNIGAAYTGDIDTCQRLLAVGNESYTDGNINQLRKVTPEGNDLVNTFTQDNLTYFTLRAVGASVFDTTGETVTIHDDGMDIDLFRIVVEAGNNYADVYDKDGEVVGQIWEGDYCDMDIEEDYYYDSITIASTASSSNISIYQCQTDILRYEVYDGESVPRIPSYPEIGESQPPGGFEPNKVYNVGPYLAVPITFKLADPKYANVDNIYRWNFYTESWYPTITWPTGVIWEGGTAPTIAASTYYEIRIRKAGNFLLGSFKTYPLV